MSHRFLLLRVSLLISVSSLKAFLIILLSGAKGDPGLSQIHCPSHTCRIPVTKIASSCKIPLGMCLSVEHQCSVLIGWRKVLMNDEEISSFQPCSAWIKVLQSFIAFCNRSVMQIHFISSKGVQSLHIGRLYIVAHYTSSLHVFVENLYSNSLFQDWELK